MVAGDGMSLVDICWSGNETDGISVQFSISVGRNTPSRSVIG